MTVAIIIIAVLLIALLAAVFAVYRKLYYVPRDGKSETDFEDILLKNPYAEETVRNTEELYETPCERVSVRSYDGLRLSARYYLGADDMPLCICFHGYHGSGVRDFSSIARFLMSEGYNVILVDERAHWKSEGHSLTFGIKERYDVQSWIQYANKRFGEDMPIFVFGISMGGGTVLMASGLDLPRNVKGIVADCPFNSPMDEILYVCRKMGLNPTLCKPLVWLSAIIFGRFNVSITTSADEVKKTKTPILLIHGEGDDFVPTDMSRQIHSANPDMTQLYTFPDAGHGMSFMYDAERYKEIVRQFMEECEKPSS